MKNSNFDHLISKYVAGDVTTEEKLKIEAWLDLMKTEATPDLDMTDDEQQMLYDRIIDKQKTVKDIRMFEPGSLKKEKQSRVVWRMAASLVLMCLLGYAVWGYLNVADNETTNGIRKLTLNDGSLVWVKGKTQLSYQDKPDGRFAILQGEALFEVAKDASRPFLISCGEISVKVVGTSFLLKTNEDKIELKVLTGKVNLSTLRDQKGIDITPREQAVYTSAGEIEKKNLEESEIRSIVAKTEYNMSFDNNTLDGVFERLSKKFDVKIVKTGRQFSKCVVTIDLSDESLDQSLKSLSELVDLDYKIEKNSVVISGAGCN